MIVVSQDLVKYGKNSGCLILHELCNALMVTAQCTFDVSGRAVAQANPDHLWRMSEQRAPIAEIDIFRDDSELIVAGKLPQGFVGHLAKTCGVDMRRIRKQISQLLDEKWRQVLIK